MREVNPKLTSRNHKIKNHLESFISEKCLKKRVAVLLSGGADSTVVALAAHHIGKKITAFSFQVNGMKNDDFNQAMHTCEVMGWEFIPVKVSKTNLYKRFMELFSEYGCKKKTEAECLFPMLDVIQAVRQEGFSQVLTGFGSFIPTNRNASILCSKDPKQYWSLRSKQADIGDSTATEKIIEVAKDQKLQILMPLCNQNMISALSGLTTKEMMGRPYPKHHYKDIYYDDFVEIGTLKGRSGSLQVNGHIEQLFSPLLSDPRIKSYKLSGDVKRQLTTLCGRLGKETTNQEIPVSASTKKSKIKTKYKPYTLDLVKRLSKKKLFTVVSTFAGGGGSSTGYRLAGGNIIFVNEFVEDAVKSYKKNYPETPVIDQDIRKINRGKDNVIKTFQQHGINQYELDILDGSPPCVTFSTSTAGRGKEKMAKKNVIYSDTKQSRIGFLIHDYVFMANVMQPKVCIIENVQGIARSPVFNHAIDRLKRYGYIISYKKLSSSDYATPQKRERLFTLAVRPDIAQKVGIRNSDDLEKVFPVPSNTTVTVRQALSGLTIDPQERDMLLTKARKDSLYEIMKRLPFNPKKHTRIIDIIPDWKTDFNLTRLCWDLPATTITATGAQGRGGLCHPEENRLLTINELKRLMGVPDDFHLTGTFEQKAERLGRMVPPLMMQAIAESVFTNILKKAS